MSNRHPLNFDQLRQANLARCVEWFHALEDWSPLEWAGAAGGEMGEAQNLCKKLKRGDEVAVQDIAYELADTIAYVDLLAARLGIDLGDAIARKFNVVSRRVKSPHKLPRGLKDEIVVEVVDIVDSQFRGLTDVIITRETRLAEDLNADSLDAVEIEVSLEDEFDIKIDDEEMEAVKTVGDIVDLVTEKRAT